MSSEFMSVYKIFLLISLSELFERETFYLQLCSSNQRSKKRAAATESGNEEKDFRLVGFTGHTKRSLTTCDDSCMYVKIPKALCNTAEIHKFVEPIEDFTFKKTQHHLRDAIEYYLRPRIRIALAQLWSENNWKIKLEEHKRRLFREQQRTILYQAMLRHHVYPKYWQFQEEFYGHVKDIDFFKFVILRCYKPQVDKAETTAETGEKVRFETDPRASTDRPPSIVEFPESPRFAEGGLQMRHSIAKYRSRTPPKCITTLTHITDQLDD